jgi:hypothetical protein
MLIFKNWKYALKTYGPPKSSNYKLDYKGKNLAVSFSLIVTFGEHFLKQPSFHF